MYQRSFLKVTLVMWDVDIKVNGMKGIQELCELSLQLSCRIKIILKLKDYLKKKPHLLHSNCIGQFALP